jgi:hypothetical protein
MNKTRKMAGLFFPILIVLAFLALKFWAQQEECVEHPTSFAESFNNTNFKDKSSFGDPPEPVCSVAHWDDGSPPEVPADLPGYITLQKTGEEFLIRNPAYIPIWINTVTAGDFDNDGWPDFIGSSSDYSNVLAFVKNDRNGGFNITYWIDGSQGVGGNPTRGVKNTAIDGSGHCGLTSGDYDADGDLDFLFIASSNNSPYNPKRIWLYQNQLIETGSLSFTQIDKTGSWTASLKGIAWSSTMMVTVALDTDGAPDIIMGNKAGEVVKINNDRADRKMDAPNKWTISTILTGSRTGWTSHPYAAGWGVSTVSVTDFDRDGDLDMILGSVSFPGLQYWKNDGMGIFSLFKTYTDSTKIIHNDNFDGAATVSIAHDFNNDGWTDLIIGTDDWNYDTDTKEDAHDGSGLGGQCYYFVNNGQGDFTQKLIFDGQLANPVVWDFDLGVALDFNKNGLMDFLIADGNHSQKYYLFVNTMADVYVLNGVAQSSNVTPALDPNLYAITKVRIKNLSQSIIGSSSTGLDVTYYVSNNDGKDWEYYARFAGNDIKSYTEMPWHTFVNYGSKLRWKAVMTATDDHIPAYPNSSYETPKIDDIEFDVVYVDRKEYSRTSVAATIADDSGQRIELIIGGTFYYPGWQGHLIAYDVSGMSAVNSTFSELRTVSRSNLSAPSGRDIVAPGVTIRWDAGSLLNARLAAGRNIYTAVPKSPGPGFDRKDFTVANVDDLSPYLQDTQSDNDGLIEFVRGVDRYWKLGDINHSNPVVVGPPNGDSLLMGPGYETFKTTEGIADRKKVLYVGANDGMLHCFDVLNGEELWGFIPYNLLPKLKNMWAVDATNGDRYFYRDVYVDGSPAVADVLIDGNWRTILVCGQGPGKGSIIGGGANYYFALDVTNPDNPLPLWELTDETMGETWSVPAIARVTKDGQPTWVGFIGSGYDNDTTVGAVLGNVFYAIDLKDGSIFWTYTASEVNTSSTWAGNINIQNTMPGSPSAVDINTDGYAERVYIGDLDGSMYRMDVSTAFENAGSWSASAIYTDPDNYPIITEPAVWKNPNNMTADPRVYFGTGGDDMAPSDATYSFVALVDKGTSAEVEWFLGNPSGTARPSGKDVGDLGIGEKVWADPKIEDYIVYFSTLTGSIESVDPCYNLAGLGKLYGRFVIPVAGTPVGGTAFKAAAGAIESLILAIKTRSAVTIGEQEITEGGVRKRDVYIQEYNSTIQRLEQLAGGVLKVKSWREVYNIFKQ